MSRTLLRYIGTILAMFAVVVAVSFTYTTVLNGIENLSGVGIAAAFGGDAGGNGADGGESGGGCCGGGKDHGQGDGKDHGDKDKPVDVCPNLSGKQTSVPSGHAKVGGKCLPDICPNIPGVQTSIPSGKIKDAQGNCVPPPVDVCPNIDGLQENVPAGYAKNSAGDCVIDVCPNLDGIQESIPDGYEKDDSGNCVVPPTDVCPNIPGVQATVPYGKVIDENGNCVKKPQCVAPTLIIEDHAEGVVGEPFEFVLNLTKGTEPVTFSAAPLPPGLSLVGNKIVGTPTEEGVFIVHVSATNLCGDCPHDITITITKKNQCDGEAPILEPNQNVSGTVGAAFSYEVEVSNEPTEVTASSLPPGLSIDTDTGIISGTPTETGTFNVTIKASNNCGDDEDILIITITAGVCIPGVPTITSADTVNGTVGSPLSYAITTDKTVTEYDAVNLPAGLLLATSTGVISGIPAESGEFDVTIKASNQCGVAEKVIKIIVTAPQCTTPAPVIESALTASHSVGSSFSYTLTASGVVSSLSAEGLPSWLTFDPQTGILSGIPTEAGTFTVILKASNPCASDQETLVLTVTEGGGSCSIPAPSITSSLSMTGTVNQQLSYTITTSGTVDSIEVTNIPSWLNFSTTSNVLFGTPTEAGDFTVHIKAVNQCGFDEENLVISVISAPPPCPNCGGGGFFSPTVVLTKATSSPLASFATVYLSQVPYTGVGDIVLTLGFLFGLMALSVAIAYVFVYRKPFALRLARHGYSLWENRRAFSSMSARTNNPGEEMSGGEAGSSSESNVKTFYSAGIGESIAEGLASVKKAIENRGGEGEKEVSPVAPVFVPTPAAATIKQTLEDEARAAEVLLGDDSAEIILAASDGKEENAIRILNQIISVAKEWYPSQEDNYLLLDGEKVRAILFSTYISMVPLFIRWISENNHQKVFNFIRMLNYQGHVVSDFVKAVAYELDRVYRFRTEHEVGADEYAIDATSSWKKETLEKAVAILVGAFDDSYSSSSVASKLAFTKLLDLVQNQDRPTTNFLKLHTVI